MVTSAILQRTFHIKYDYAPGHAFTTGTAFTFEQENVQFLATTAHTFPYVENRAELYFSVMRHGEWHAVKSKIFIHPITRIDIAVLTLPADISPRHEIELGVGQLFLSQDAYFLGFPYQKFMLDTEDVNNGFPFPYVRRGSFATIPFRQDELELIYVDGTNNPGFSGGPCVFNKIGSQQHTVCGLVKGYFPHEVQIETPFGDKYFFNANSGLVEVHSIRHLLEMFPLDT